MKKLFLILLSFLLLSPSYVQGQKKSEEIPSALHNAFADKFPQAKKINWEAEENGEYEVSFKMNGKKFAASFSQNAEWLETETTIKARELPTAVSEAIATGFAGYKIEELEKVETSKGGFVYEAELEKDEQTIEVVFSSDGQVLSQEDDDEGEN